MGTETSFVASRFSCLQFWQPLGLGRVGLVVRVGVADEPVQLALRFRLAHVLRPRARQRPQKAEHEQLQAHSKPR